MLNRCSRLKQLYSDIIYKYRVAYSTRIITVQLFTVDVHIENT